MAERSVEPTHVVELVEGYVSKELDSAERYENRQPLDAGGVYSLHRLAAEVYAMGWNDGEQSASRRGEAQRYRDREAQKSADSGVSAE